MDSATKEYTLAARKERSPHSNPSELRDWATGEKQLMERLHERGPQLARPAS